MNDPRVEAARIRARLWMVSAMHASREQVIRDEVFCAYEVIQAADAADREQGIHRVRMDDEAAGGLAQVIHDNLCGCSEEYVECDGYFSVPETMLNAARAVLAALTEAKP